ncbi:hypothetical protein ACHAW6_009528 [Cyclotella cf. meneghiniana]
MEYILTFEHFHKPKTCENVSAWITESLREATAKNSDASMLSAYGASNAIGSIAEYEYLSGTDQSNDIKFNVCLAHQNECSGDFHCVLFVLLQIQI